MDADDQDRNDAEHHQAMLEREQETLMALKVASSYGVPEPTLFTLAAHCGLVNELYRELRK